MQRERKNEIWEACVSRFSIPHWNKALFLFSQGKTCINLKKVVWGFVTEKCYWRNNHHELAKWFHPTGLPLKEPSTAGSNYSLPLVVYLLWLLLETHHLITSLLQEGCQHIQQPQPQQISTAWLNAIYICAYSYYFIQSIFF